MKNYEKPNLYIIKLDEMENILTASGDLLRDNDADDTLWNLQVI